MIYKCTTLNCSVHLAASFGIEQERTEREMPQKT